MDALDAQSFVDWSEELCEEKRQLEARVAELEKNWLIAEKQISAALKPYGLALFVDARDGRYSIERRIGAALSPHEGENG